MNTFALANKPPTGSLGGCPMGETGVPSNRNAYGPAIDEIDH